MIFTPRDWQAMAQREASDLLGTPEGTAKLAEAKRYGALADVIEQQHRDIERLRAEVARLSDPGTSYAACTSHRFHRYSMKLQATVMTPMRSVCPICAGMAMDVSGPHLPGLGA